MAAAKTVAGLQLSGQIALAEAALRALYARRRAMIRAEVDAGARVKDVAKRWGLSSSSVGRHAGRVTAR